MASENIAALEAIALDAVGFAIATARGAFAMNDIADLAADHASAIT